MRRQSSMRGEFRYTALGGSPGAWQVFRRLGAVTDYVGNAVRRGERGKTDLWDGSRDGKIVCPKYRSREQVAYCLDRTRREEGAG